MPGSVPDLERAGSFALGPWRVHRIGYGAMQLAGDGVFGPPRDRDEALRVLRAAVDAGVDHIDTAQYYGPGVVNELIREALYPYPSGLAIVSKVAARRDDAGAVLPFDDPHQLRRGIEDNLATLGVSRLAVVNLADQRSLDVLKECRDRNIAFVPYCPLGWPRDARNQILTSPVLAAAAARLEATPVQIALAWLLDLAPNVLLIPGTRTRNHLAENLRVATVQLDEPARQELARHFPTVR
jgi:pyridoxine 4-dehydrogenase